jgi:hypothetical protein
MTKRKKEQRVAEARSGPGKMEQVHIQRSKDRWSEREKSRGPVQVKAGTDQASGGLLIDAPHSDVEGYSARLGDAFGTVSVDFVREQMAALEWATRARGKARSEEVGAQHLNSALAIVEAVGPECELEAALAVQLAGCHALTMEMLGRAKSSDRTDHTQLYGNMALKLQRTFAASAEALAKLRRGGEQVVKYVHVHEGGQAVVAGTINQGGGGRAPEIGRQSHAQISASADASLAALPGAHSQGQPVPVPRDAERPLPDAWRDESGSAQG